MAYARASDKIFIDGTIYSVAKLGIENMRTKHVADYAGFSEATLFRRFPTKDILLRDTFLYIDKKISKILTENTFIRKPDDTPFELVIYAIWHKVFRHLIDNREETIFLIRYRYSSLYTDEVRNMRQAYNGAFDRVYDVLERYYGTPVQTYRGFLISYVFEITLGFAEKIISGKIKDNLDTEHRSWLAVTSSIDALVRQ